MPSDRMQGGIDTEYAGPEWVLRLPASNVTTGIRRMFETRVTEVHLGGAPIDDDWLDRLRPWTDLRILELCDTPITDAGLVNLEGLASLEFLNLARTRIIPASEPHERRAEQRRPAGSHIVYR